MVYELFGFSANNQNPQEPNPLFFHFESGTMQKYFESKGKNYITKDAMDEQ